MKRIILMAAAFCLLIGCDKPAVTVNTIKLNYSTLNLTVGESYTITATVDPVDASNSAYTWSSDDATIASVDQSGKITALKDGSTNIKATLTDGSKSATCKVTVTDPGVLKGIAIEPASFAVGVTGKKQLEVTYTPNTATNKKVTWESSDKSVATVSSSGMVTAVAIGSANITAKSDDGGYTATCKVSVKETELYYENYFDGFHNGSKYSNPNGTLQWFYSDGQSIYEGISSGDASKNGVYKDGSLWLKMEFPKEGELVSIVGNKLYFWDHQDFEIYDSVKKSWVFDNTVTDKPSFHFTDYAIAPDGTAYLSGRYKDTSHNNGGMVAVIWTISKDQKTVTETVLKQNSSVYEYNAVSVAVDKNGDVWALTYRANAFSNGGLKLYKNGNYQRKVTTDMNPNDCHFIAFHGSDQYVIVTNDPASEIRVYKNNSSSPLYKYTHQHYFTADKPYFNTKGDLFFSAFCSNERKSFLYKNGQQLYTLDESVRTMGVLY